MIATGTFKARGCSDLEIVKSSKQETPGVRVLLQLLEGPDKGSTIEWVGWVSDKTIERTNESLGFMGYDGENPSSVKNKDVSIVIEKEQYDRQTESGQTVTNEKAVVRWINDPNAAGGRFLATTASEQAGIMQRLKAAGLAAKSRTANSAPANAEDEPQF
jgi:hypothetical protein